ncbi:unnamed protein product, partial [Heterosigma akashiwo]
MVIPSVLPSKPKQELSSAVPKFMTKFAKPSRAPPGMPVNSLSVGLMLEE